MDTVSDVGHAGANLESRKKRRRRRRIRCQNRQSDNIQLGQHINSVNHNVEYSVDQNIRKITGGDIHGNIIGGDVAVEPSTDHQKSVRVSKAHPLNKPVESGKEITKGIAINKADQLNGSLGNHTVVMSNLSLADARVGLTDDKSTKTMATPQQPQRQQQQQQQHQQQQSFYLPMWGMAVPPPPPQQQQLQQQQHQSFYPPMWGMAAIPPPLQQQQPTLYPTMWGMAMPEQQQQQSLYPFVSGMTIPQDPGFFVRKDSSICTSQHVNGVHYPSEITSSDVCNGANLCFVPNLYVSRSPVLTRRKLLVLDLNGLLAHIVMPSPQYGNADAYIAGRAIFKRPFYHDFLMFCCERFDVGIWSSRSKKIIDRIVDYLLGDLKHKLLFCWNMNQCTVTRFKTLENKHKPLVFKELRKLWEKHYPDLPWEKGYYDESNTVLLDDSPYKALLNPLNTAIFPFSYQYGDKSDNSLGPGGDLRVYLEGLSTTDNAQKYIEQHPFGQGAIDEQHPFYSTVLHSCSVT